MKEIFIEFSIEESVINCNESLLPPLTHQILRYVMVLFLSESLFAVDDKREEMLKKLVLKIY